jgi:hypothetical protein
MEPDPALLAFLDQYTDEQIAAGVPERAYQEQQQQEKKRPVLGTLSTPRPGKAPRKGLGPSAPAPAPQHQTSIKLWARAPGPLSDLAAEIAESAANVAEDL